MPVENAPPKPCKRGHTAPRRANRTCVECERLRNLSISKNEEKQREYQNSYNERHRDKLRLKSKERMKTFREAFPDRVSVSKQKQEVKRIERQERAAGRPKPKTCEVCGGSRRISFDHCHSTGEFRGWLCMPCNVALGQVKDNPMTLRLLADYLERKETNHACVG